MRSSIACARCRRSKIKCINGGINTTCRACESSGRECTYPPSAPTGADRLLKPDGGRPEGESPRKRVKKSQGGTSFGGDLRMRESPRSLVDALDPALLTPAIWNELFDLFQLHFSTDLPFLHPPTFLKPLRQTVLKPIAPNTSPAGPDSPPASPLLLLALLTLTARFHPTLSAHHSPPSSAAATNPMVASEYYASALRNQLAGHMGENLVNISIERIQALLMLGLHEWGMCRGIKAWIYVGVAVRMSQAMGLEFEQELDDEPLALSSAMTQEMEHMGLYPSRRGSTASSCTGEEFVQQEIRRRTFWSCFILDRYLSSGKYRPQMVSVKDLRIQLPSSERAFMFGEKVRTKLLGEEIDDAEAKGRKEVQQARRASVIFMNGGESLVHPDKKPEREPEKKSKDEDILGDRGRWEVGEEEGVLSRVVKIVELWGRIAKWSCKGGRRTEIYPPWKSECHFYALRVLLSDFHSSLPRNLTFSTQNLNAHITSRTSTPYTLLHTVYFLCLIVLHREYVPFVPIRCPKPIGPLDAPTFPPEKYDIPEGFWEQSARECFGAARDMMVMFRTCSEWGVLVETPMVGFAIYTVAFVGVYCMNFPLMDPDGFMCNPVTPVPQPNYMYDVASPAAVVISPAPPSLHPDYHTNKLNNRKGEAHARRAVEMLGHLRPRLKMADGWFRTIHKMFKYFVKIKQDYQRNTRAMASSASESEGDSARAALTRGRFLSLREGGEGGGLEEYKLLEKTLKEFGSLEDEEGDLFSGTGTSTSDRGGSIVPSSIPTVKSEAMEVEPLGSNIQLQVPQNNVQSPQSAAPTAPMSTSQTSSSTANDRWMAINSVAAAAYQQQANFTNPQTSQPPPPTFYHTAVTPPNHPPPLMSPGQSSTPGTAGGMPSPFSHARQSSWAGPSTQPFHTQAAPNQQSITGSSPSGLHNATIQQQQQQQVYPDQTHVQWTQADKDAWLASLNTASLGGDDVAAFVDGMNWEDLAFTGAGGNGGNTNAPATPQASGMSGMDANTGWLASVWGGGFN